MTGQVKWHHHSSSGGQAQSAMIVKISSVALSAFRLLFTSRLLLKEIPGS